MKKLNPHYNYENPDNQACIKDVQAYDEAYKVQNWEYIHQCEKLVLKGAVGYAVGVSVESPWGQNKVLSVESKDDLDVVRKEIVVKPGFMLSLQRHRGRQELWEVKSGVLTVISDGKKYEVLAGESIFLQKGNVHCMINMHDNPVTVHETQTGFCREADNVRLLDFNNRPTYPLTTKTEAQSAILYSQIQQEIQKKFSNNNAPYVEFLTEQYKETVDSI